MTYPSDIDVSDICYEWKFVQTYSFEDRGTIEVSLDMQRTVCKEGFKVTDDEDSLIWVSVIAIALSLISFIGIWIYFKGMTEHLRKL